VNLWPFALNHCTLVASTHLMSFHAIRFRTIAQTRAEAVRLGVDRFFTGKPCCRGHIAPRYVSSPNCATCLVEHARKNGGWNARPKKSVFLDTIRSIVEARGGSLVSNAYVSAKKKLRVRCGRSHVFAVTPDNLRHGRWCPTCKFENNATRQAAKFLTVAELNGIARERFGGSLPKRRPRCTRAFYGSAVRKRTSRSVRLFLT